MSPQDNKITLCDIHTHRLTMVSSFLDSMQILCFCTNTDDY